MQQIGRHPPPLICIHFRVYFWENEYNCNYIIGSKWAKWAIFKRQTSINWSILVRNEMWVAKVLLHIFLQNFWESWFFGKLFFPWIMKTSKMGHFWNAQLYCLINTSWKWGLSSQNFSSHIFSSFLGQTCCLQHVFSWGAWVSESKTQILKDTALLLDQY